MKGRIVWFNDDKGYGIIESEEGESYFAQATEIKNICSKKLKADKFKKNISVKFKIGPESNRLSIPRAKNIFEL